MNAVALAEVDLEGAAAVVESWPYPADKRLKEKQPFTWLAAAPYIAVILAGAALFAAGVAVVNSDAPAVKTESDEEGQPYHVTARHVVGTTLWIVGTLLWIVGFLVPRGRRRRRRGGLGVQPPPVRTGLANCLANAAVCSKL
jgi:hypothetical protein